MYCGGSYLYNRIYISVSYNFISQLFKTLESYWLHLYLFEFANNAIGAFKSCILISNNLELYDFILIWYLIYRYIAFKFKTVHYAK